MNLTLAMIADTQQIEARLPIVLSKSTASLAALMVLDENDFVCLSSAASWHWSCPPDDQPAAMGRLRASEIWVVRNETIE